MTIEGLAILLVIGLVAGWLAARLLHGRGFGLVGNMVVGVIGAFIGGVIADFLDVRIGGLLEEIIAATLGAAIFLFILGLIKR